MIRAALYIRVSTEEQAIHGISLEAQKVALTDYARKNNYEIVGYYEDEGISARKKLYRREAYQNLINDVELNKIDIILFTKLDRWFRNIADYYKAQEILEKNNVNWKTIYENYDTSTASGRLHINIMLSVAQDEADRTSERIKAVFKNKIANSEPVFGYMPYGYSLIDKKMVVNQDEAERVKDVFSAYIRLRSKYATVRYYNDKYNEHRSYDFISDMLNREFYIGKYKNNCNFCEPIIDIATFNEANKDKAESFVRANQTKRIYIYSGLVKCAECGRLMNGLTTDTRHKNVAGETVIYKKYTSYRCKYGVSMKSDCKHNKSIREDVIEDLLTHDIEKLIKKQVDEVKKITVHTDKRTYVQKIKSNKTRLSKLQELFLNDLISIDDYKKEYKNINDELNELAQLSSSNDSTPLLAQTLIDKDFKDVYKITSRIGKRDFWHKVIKEIVVDADNNISVIFK